MNARHPAAMLADFPMCCMCVQLPCQHLFSCAMWLLLQVGTHTFTVTSSTGPVVVSNSPLAVNVFPAATAADASALYVDLASPAVGATATVTVYPRDRFSTPLPSATGVQLTIQGRSVMQCSGSKNLHGHKQSAFMLACLYRLSRHERLLQRLAYRSACGCNPGSTQHGQAGKAALTGSAPIIM
jgi:hypothetical protein